MNQRYMVLAFLAALLLVCAAAYFVGRLLLPPDQAAPRPRAEWTPPVAGATVTGWPGATAMPTGQGGTGSGTLRPTPTPTARSTTTIPTAGGRTPTALPSPTDSPTATVTPTPSATSPTVIVFELARPLRHSTGDCPGSYVLGSVADAAGRPLPDVRLTLVDEWGNTATAVSKSAAGELGRYDFPLFGARRYYLTVVDSAGRPLSARIEIAHGIGPNAAATCHWADWRRR